MRKTFLNKLQPKIKYLNYLINLKFDFRRIYGIILSIKDGVAKIIGLQKVKSGEMVYLGLINYSLQSPNGMVLSLNKGYISVACFDGGVSTLKCGDRVFRTFRLISIPFSLSLFGRTLDPLGVPLDGLYSLQSNLFLEIDTKAVGIIPRESVKEPMQTGVLAVDALTPIGCGQRELLIGDRCEEFGYKELWEEGKFQYQYANSLSKYVRVFKQVIVGTSMKIIRKNLNDAFLLR